MTRNIFKAALVAAALSGTGAMAQTTPPALDRATDSTGTLTINGRIPNMVSLRATNGSAFAQTITFTEAQLNATSATAIRENDFSVMLRSNVGYVLSAAITGTPTGISATDSETALDYRDIGFGLVSVTPGTRVNGTHAVSTGRDYSVVATGRDSAAAFGTANLKELVPASGSTSVQLMANTDQISQKGAADHPQNAITVLGRVAMLPQFIRGVDAFSVTVTLTMAQTP